MAKMAALSSAAKLRADAYASMPGLQTEQQRLAACKAVTDYRNELIANPGQLNSTWGALHVTLGPTLFCCERAVAIAL